ASAWAQQLLTEVSGIYLGSAVAGWDRPLLEISRCWLGSAAAVLRGTGPRGGGLGRAAQGQQPADGEGDEHAQQRAPLPGHPHLADHVVLHREEEGVDGHRHDDSDVGDGGASPPVVMPATPRASTTMLRSSERNIVAGAMNARPQPMVAQRPTRSPCSSVIGARRRRPTTSVTVEDDSADSEEDSVDIAAARMPA